MSKVENSAQDLREKFGQVSIILSLPVPAAEAGLEPLTREY